MGRMNKSLNYYEVLEVSNDATADAVHRAYLAAKQTYSNDNPALYSVFSKDEASELLKMIDEAYQVLSNNESRQKYDITLKKSNEPTGTEAQTSSDAPTSVSTASAMDVPKGHAKTKWSVYKLDNVFEEQIKNTYVFTGEFLKRIREYKNLTIEQVSGHTRISKTYINAIELENYSQLPAQVFLRGFIAQLAKTYGVDEKQAASSYIERYKTSVG